MEKERLPENVDYELLTRVLSGEAGEEERDQLEAWVNQSGENASFFALAKALWMEAAPDHFDEPAEALEIDTDKAWESVRSRIIEIPEKRKVIRLAPWFRVAAIFVSILTIGFIAYQSMMGPDEQTIVAEAGNEKVDLPDGSLIELNEHAELTYEENFKGDERKVKLKGEAFFEVKPDKSKPFVVETKGLSVKVLGTSFNVNAEAAEDSIEVHVETGIVQLANPAGNLELHAGETGVFLVRENKLLKRNRVIISSEFWRNRKLNFRRTPLRDVVMTLNKYYNVDINLEGDGLDREEISVRFKDQDIEFVLEILARTLELEVEQIDDKRMVLKRKHD